MVTKATGKMGDKGNDCYQPKATFKGFLDSRLLVLKEQRRLQSLKPGRMKLAEWAKSQKENTRKKRASDKEKVRYLNTAVFPSMANVIYFLEAVAKHPELQKDFDDALKDLLGYRRERWADAPALRRLVDSMLGRNYQGDRDNFRLVLMHWMQLYLGQNILLRAHAQLEGLHGTGLVGQDLARMLLWTELLAKVVVADRQQPSRPVRF